MHTVDDGTGALLASILTIGWQASDAGDLIGEQPLWGAYTGQSPDQYQAGGWISAIHPEDRAAVSAAWRGARSDLERGVSIMAGVPSRWRADTPSRPCSA